jgi:hypothetical protein
VAKRLPNARLEVVPGAGHLLILRAGFNRTPAEVAQALANLQGVRLLNTFHTRAFVEIEEKFSAGNYRLQSNSSWQEPTIKTSRRNRWTRF